MFDGELWTGEAACAPAELAFRVESVASSASHSFSKRPGPAITLLKGLGVLGDAHCGAFDQHLWRGEPDAPPNLRQVHLFAGETMDRLRAEGFALAPGAIGENLLTRGVDLLALPLGTRLMFQGGAEVRLTGRRTPCRKVERLGKGLMKVLSGPRAGPWGLNAIAGVMAVIVEGGMVTVGDTARAEPPPQPWLPLPPL
jgi:hypothetical protein